MRLAFISLLALLAVAACAKPEPTRSVRELPAGLHLAHNGVSADGTQALLVGDGADRCFEAVAYVLTGTLQPLPSATGPKADPAGCAARTAAASADGSALAVYAYNLGHVHLVRRVGQRLAYDGEIRLPGVVGFRYPPPGRNLTLSSDGANLLVGALERNCRPVLQGGGCGAAFLYRRQTSIWRLAATLNRPDGAEPSAQFGQAVLLLPDGALLIGGAGLTGGTGALNLFLPRGNGFELVQVLRPDRRDEFFTTDLAASGDGQWLAVGGAQSVLLYRREGERFRFVKRLQPPEREVGHFGEAVALDGLGRTLLVGAPRTDCEAGARCGIAFRYVRDGDFWQLAGPLRPAKERAEADFGHEAALDASGRLAAVEGEGVHLELR